MNITLITVGKVKEKFYSQAIDEYAKRLRRYCNFNLVEVPDEKAPESLSGAERVNVVSKEGKRIQEKIPSRATVITLEIDGKQMTSMDFSKTMEGFAIEGQSHLCFIIGGSLGLSQEVRKISNLRLSFSEMTFPHQLFRVMLLEQIYRGFKIIKNEPYHK